MDTQQSDQIQYIRMEQEPNGDLAAHHYTISGVDVAFPVRAYPSQVAMMSKIITALQKGQNSLLESPTGSGKSLALLCAALAWQNKEAQLVKAYNVGLEMQLIQQDDAAYAETVPDNCPDESMNEGSAAMGGDEGKLSGGFVPGSYAQDDEDDDFVRPGFARKHVPLPAADYSQTEGEAPPPEAAVSRRKPKFRTVPKIYFGTRTHKQIAQIVRELKKTAYKDARMTILASRDHTCINKSVLAMKNRTEGCKELSDRRRQTGQSCPFRSNVRTKMGNHQCINSYRGTSVAWDLEDIVKLGKKIRCCPYYGTRELKQQSQIIFCPYNYLVEPLIRKSMEINLAGQVVILDEAHNIEDSARSAASWEVSQDTIRDTLQDLEKVAATGQGPTDSYREMAILCSSLSSWIDAFKDKLENFSDFGSASKVWSGAEAVALFIHYGFGPGHLEHLKHHLGKVVEEAQAMAADDEPEQGSNLAPVVRLHGNSMDLLDNLVLVLEHLYMKDQKYRNDFRIALVRTQSRKPARASLGNDWLSKSFSSQRGTQLTHTFTANFWCLNPAVAFDELKESVRSIVLTSGTLSPMNSFASELDVRFPIQLEANHVIDKKQVWVGTVSHGPSGHSLNATFKNAESYGFLDELGRLTIEVCRTIEQGVLLFVPSYRMLSNLLDRWQNSGLWSELTRWKVVISEPKMSSEFDASMRHFYEIIQTTSKDNDGSGINGALFIAVFRGKVSEGLDFADNHARAVICVGIPFPNVKDIQVNLKMKYNDLRRQQEAAILSGRDWYEIQAFRALNQALGRCIRHRRDWGAILMVDDRYQTNGRYIDSLSKWVRSRVMHHQSWQQVITQLKDFHLDMRASDAIDIHPIMTDPVKDHKPEVKPIGSSVQVDRKPSESQLAAADDDCYVKRKFHFSPDHGTPEASSEQKRRNRGAERPRKNPVVYQDSDDDFV